jgi:rhodanese-related sulfurtransferase
MTSDSLEIDPQGLDALRSSGADIQILDVREDWELTICALPDCIEIPMMQIPGQTGQLSADKPLVVICHHGQRSLQVVTWLRDNGFANALSLRGGLEDWATTIDPAMKRY